MAKKFGKLPTEILKLPYGEFLINLFIMQVGEGANYEEIHRNPDDVTELFRRIICELI